MSESVAIVLAAGQGKRMHSALPKVLHRGAGVPMVLHVVRAVQAAGIGRVIVVLGHGGERVQPALPSNVETVIQSEQLGTGHATACGVARLGKDWQGDVVVCSGDCPLLTELGFSDPC